LSGLLSSDQAPLIDALCGDPLNDAPDRVPADPE
jgi:hypothetical protein